MQIPHCSSKGVRRKKMQVLFLKPEVISANAEVFMREDLIG